MKCAICGQVISGRISKDHIYPRAIWKWQEEYLEEKEFLFLKSAIESSKNIAKTHPHCNKCKEDTVPDISTLTLNDKKRRQLLSVTETVTKYLPAYIDLKNHLTDLQNNRCYCCKKPLTDTSILRRIDNHKPRFLENGCIVCHDCNYSHKNFLHLQNR